MAKKKAKAKTGGAAKARTKSQVFGELAERSDLARKQVVCIFDDLADMIKKDLTKRGPGVFSVPGLMKIKKVKKPRRLARKGINPFTGEEMMFKAKPAHSVVKVLALKGLKEMV